MKLVWRLFALAFFCKVGVGCAPHVVVKDSKIISQKSYEVSLLREQNWETYTNVDTYNYPGLKFNLDFLLKNKSKNQYIFASSAVWSTSMDKIRRKNREVFAGEDTIIKYFGEDVQDLAGIKKEQIKSVKNGEMFGHNMSELEVEVPADIDLFNTGKECKIRLLVVVKGRRGNPFDPGYDFIVLGYISQPDNYPDSISEFNKVVQSFKIYD